MDLSELYSNRSDFTIIALTGRNGSGYESIADSLSKDFKDLNPPNPNIFSLEHNSYKKYKIVYNYMLQNYIPFSRIRYRDIIVLYILKYSLENLFEFIESQNCIDFFNAYDKINIDSDFTDEINELRKIENEFNSYRKIFDINNIEQKKDDKEYIESFIENFNSNEFRDFSIKFHNILKSKKCTKHNLLLELLTNNIRISGSPYVINRNNEIHIFSLVKIINRIVKFIRKLNGGNPTKVVIDSLRNPFEITYFKQRFSAFYLIAVNRDEKIREKILERHYGDEFDDIKILLEDEYVGGKGKGFYKQYVRECIEKADIHITFRGKTDTIALNKNRDASTSPYFSWKMQLIKYLSLIQQPGIVTPSPEERCMQLAYTAKFNSGCISRQVGAAVTDSNYSVKAIGWNNTPAGQTPCNLRDIGVLLQANSKELDDLNKKEREQKKNKIGIENRVNEVDDTISSDIKLSIINHSINNKEIELSAYTPFERNDENFKSVLKENFSSHITAAQKELKGRNVCYCFKSVYNSYKEGKNQVHTRSLHAEESAFLQITKYGGQPLENGKLFTTASPCELCSKKAYQLGIKVIYYVDPYPGISNEQILNTGSNKPEVRLFNGAIGSAYNWLYDPLMAYKDELSLLLGNNIEDLTKKQNRIITEKDDTIKKMADEIENLKQIIEKRSSDK